jgi:beta-galactosidase
MPIRPWATPELTSLNRLPMHSVPHEVRLPLDGTWQFQLLAAPEAEPGDEWSKAEVPGCWTMQGFSDLPHYTNVQMPFAGSPPEPPAANPTGVYRRDFDLPPEWLAERVVLHVGAAESVLIVRVNGVEVGLSKDSHLAAEFDVTRFVRAGANEIRLRVVKWSDSSYIEDQDEWWHGGITRSVFLYATRRVHLADVRAIAGLADDLAEGTLRVECAVDFGGAPESGWTIEASLGQPILPIGGPTEFGAAVPGSSHAGEHPRASTDIHLHAEVPVSLPPSEELPTRADAAPLSRHRTALVGKFVAGIEFTSEEQAQWAVESAALRPPLDGRVVLTTRVPEAVRWSAEQPALYPLAVTLRSPGGVAVEEANLRVGFRRVEISGLHLLVNGKAVPIRGVNRHDFDARTGRVVTEESMRADLVLMKRFGFNAVRTSHYPNDPAFLDLTDELGMYVVDGNR